MRGGISVKAAFRGLAIAALIAAAGGAHAATCSVSAVSLAFGAYNEFRLGHTDTTGNIAVTCVGSAGEIVAYSLGLSAGAGAFAQRRMRTPSGFMLNYNIYTSAARTLVWGDGASGTVTVNDSYALGAPSVTRNYAVYGRTFGLQKVAVGLYSDTIIVTLNF